MRSAATAPARPKVSAAIASTAETAITDANATATSLPLCNKFMIQSLLHIA
jgi:hypothetical protein